MTDFDREVYEATTICHICKKPFEKHTPFGEEKGNQKVRDHCHLTGKFRGAAHYRCNFNYKIPKFIPVIFHNLSVYDSHFFIKQLGNTKGDITCIANTEQKYITFN